jgi:predicted nucleic acid-binding protein
VHRVFADTFYWVALIHRKDARNRAALEWSRKAASVFICTTEEVLTEVLAFCSSDEGLRQDATRIVRSILSAQMVRVIPQSHESFLAGLALYEARPDKEYSLTDCISMQAMRREGLVEVLTNDRDLLTIIMRRHHRRFLKTQLLHLTSL